MTSPELPALGPEHNQTPIGELFNAGYTPADIAEATGVHPNTLAPAYQRTVEAAGGAAVSGAVEEPGRFAHLLDPNAPDPGPADIAAAAFQPTSGGKNVPPAQTSDRPGYWKPPTDVQIAANPGLGGQNKYYPSRG